MDPKEFLSSLDEMLELPAGTLTGDEQIADLDGWNSMAMIGFIALAANNGANVAPRQIAAARTVADLMKLALVHAAA